MRLQNLINNILLFPVLLLICMACSNVSVKLPGQLISEADNSASVILIRLTAKDETGKLVDISENLISGGYGATMTVKISNLSEDGLPEKIYPATDKIASFSEKTKQQGWVYFYANPGVYDINVISYAFKDNSIAVELEKHFLLNVGADRKILYAGSLLANCMDSGFWVPPSCEKVNDPIDESEVAKNIAASYFANTIPFSTELLEPTDTVLTEKNLMPIGILVQYQNNFVSPPWELRGMSRFTGIGNPGQYSYPAAGQDIARACLGAGQVCALPLMLYLMYLPIGVLAGEIYGEYTEAKWQPCMNYFQSELSCFDFVSYFGTAIKVAFSSNNLTEPFIFGDFSQLLAQSEQLGLKSLVTVRINRVQFRECTINGRFCVESSVNLSVIDLASMKLLYFKNFLYSESGASQQERPYEIWTVKNPNCYSLEAFCTQDNKLFFEQLKATLNDVSVKVLDLIKANK
ncbi:hypothetical protein [Methylomonas rhizoryzae]|uniref:hypothetical protein n=1 Tax=Methylomonas rhizoryzae TaxID=2608981 RepID=UPI001232A974|nr:hypothetical protein [Methylomonas rhizoryzae]